MSLETLIAALQKDEGLRLKPYLDTASPPRVTIGYGRNLSDKGITYNEAMEMLRSDALDAIEDAAKIVDNWAELNDVRQAVLANLVFNMGKSGVLQFRTMLGAIADLKFEEAATAMLASKWATQVGKRAQRLAEEMRTGTA
jgi:lysozyme